MVLVVLVLVVVVMVLLVVVVVVLLVLLLVLVLVLAVLVAVVVAPLLADARGRNPPRLVTRAGRKNNAPKVVSVVVFVVAFVLLLGFSYPKLSTSSPCPLPRQYQSAP